MNARESRPTPSSLSTGSIADIRTRTTPVPTPLLVRYGGSILVATALAALVSDLSLPVAAPVALVCTIAAVVLTLCHSYRRRLREFADTHNVTMMPSVQQLLPLMLLWLAIMLAPLFTLPLWGTVLVWVAGFATTVLFYPHVDGTRKMAYA